jgi:hypothetical protein
MSNNDTSDLLWGVDAIAAEINRSPRQTYHMLAKGALPARKVGNRWVASRAKLRAYIAGEPAAA